MNITKRTWLIAGAASALVLVPAGVSFAVVSAADDTPAAIADRIQARVDAPAAVGADRAPGRPGGQATNQAGGQRAGRAGNQLGATDRLQDQTGSRDRDQIRDPEYCGDDGPIGQGPPGSPDTSGPGMMGGRGPGR